MAREAAAVVPAAMDTARSDEVQVTLMPNEGKEVKLTMRQGVRVTYHWAADKSVVNYDKHADREAPPVIKYHAYAKAQGAPASGATKRSCAPEADSLSDITYSATRSHAYTRSSMGWRIMVGDQG